MALKFKFLATYVICSCFHLTSSQTGNYTCIASYEDNLGPFGLTFSFHLPQ